MNRFLAMAIAALSIFSVGCYYISNEINDTNTVYDKMFQNNDEIKYLALGDSYTIGESVEENLRWPVQLVDRLRDDSVLTADAKIIARTGWTTDELMKGIEAANPESDYNLVSLLIGVNNQYRGRDIDNFRSELAELIELAVRKAGNEKSNIIVLSIPDWGAMPFAAGRDRQQIAAEIDAYNKVVMEECGFAGVEFFDITDISRKAPLDESLVAADGLHPSGKMYGLWVNRIYTHVYELLK
ncbi:MAG: SGNH/GDSL hydrolase family protein [Bacteroidales bacterium]|nr:SGNH/GDSL hydrolase family protein [Bacteroidales bacterium]